MKKVASHQIVLRDDVFPTFFKYLKVNTNEQIPLMSRM